jgi:hypothetical protein
MLASIIPTTWSHRWLAAIPIVNAFSPVNWHFNSPLKPTPPWQRRLAKHGGDTLVQYILDRSDLDKACYNRGALVAQGAHAAQSKPSARDGERRGAPRLRRASSGHATQLRPAHRRVSSSSCRDAALAGGIARCASRARRAAHAPGRHAARR